MSFSKEEVEGKDNLNYTIGSEDQETVVKYSLGKMLEV